MLSVIIPSRLEPRIHEFVDEIERIISPTQIIVCNDRYGQGKGYAIREALKEAKGDKFIFIDGDFDIQPFEIFKILPYLEQYDVVCGFKGEPKRLDRRLLTIASKTWISFLFGIWDDTQTGIKGFNYKPEWKMNDWSFDIEIIWKAKKAGKRIITIPIQATVSDTKTLKEILRTWINSIKIRFSRE
jgi:glycosyltransferase involved in cell wall biosynthesis